jgi:hypothetical protein
MRILTDEGELGIGHSYYAFPTQPIRSKFKERLMELYHE